MELCFPIGYFEQLESSDWLCTAIDRRMAPVASVLQAGPTRGDLHHRRLALCVNRRYGRRFDQSEIVQKEFIV